MTPSVLLAAVESRLLAAGLLGDFVRPSLNCEGDVLIFVLSPGDLVLTDSGEVRGGDPVLEVSSAPASAPTFAEVAALFPGAWADANLAVLAISSL